ncbi:MAG: hypothetical protein JST06_03325 [Bacteroidetes bacterium]|nr:hypothetical protein [Bacteroidota bacterium]MBS1630482.1 hypothetical protein [Bacteroidota bacterium]
MKYFLLVLLSLLVVNHPVAGQQLFEEGVIVYSVRVGPLEAGGGYLEHAGTYTLTLKDSYLRKELRMNSGYQNVIIINKNTGSIYSLRPANGQCFAIQLRKSDLEDKMKPYMGFSEQPVPGKMTIAGQPCRKLLIQYKDGSSSILYYAANWKTNDSSLFERFPGFSYIPLSFEYRNEEGITMHFAAEKLEVKPIENSVFRVPPECKIITNAEYKSLRN